MTRAAAESILHGFLAALAVALILSLGRVRDPGTRVRFWLLALAAPVLLPPLFAWLYPPRLAEAFRDRWALFSGDRLAAPAGPDSGVVSALAWLLALGGLALYLRDLVPLLVDFTRGRRGHEPPPVVPDRLPAALAQAAAAQGMAAPRLRLRDTRYPILMCRGWRRPLIVASTGVLEMLTPDELDAALAHELAHARRHDPALGWGLLLVRGLFCFNPWVQLCARALTLALEQRADQDAAEALGSPTPVLSSLRKLGDPDAANPAGRRAGHTYRLRAIADRCQRLRARHDQRPTPPWTLAATAIGLGVILFFTVA